MRTAFSSGFQVSKPQNLGPRPQKWPSNLQNCTYQISGACTRALRARDTSIFRGNPSAFGESLSRNGTQILGACTMALWALDTSIFHGNPSAFGESLSRNGTQILGACTRALWALWALHTSFFPGNPSAFGESLSRHGTRFGVVALSMSQCPNVLKSCSEGHPDERIGTGFQRNLDFSWWLRRGARSQFQGPR